MLMISCDATVWRRGLLEWIESYVWRDVIGCVIFCEQCGVKLCNDDAPDSVFVLEIEKQ